MSACSVGLRLPDGQVVSSVQPMQRGHAEALIPAIQALLARHGVAFSDIDAYAAVRGPGAFAGLRIGLAAARMFALASKKPLLGVTSLEALLLQADSEDAVAVVETKRSDYYVQCAGGDPECLEAEGLSARLKNKNAIIIGDANARVRNECRYNLNSRFIDIFSPAPESVIACAAEYWQKADTTDQRINTDPFYIRPPDVTVSHRKKIVIAE